MTVPAFDRFNPGHVPKTYDPEWLRKQLTSIDRHLKLVTQYFPRDGETEIVDPRYAWEDAERFGLVGDGVTDETIKLKAALRASNGRRLRLGYGKTYGITSRITLAQIAADGIEIEGNFATIKALPGFSSNVVWSATSLNTSTGYQNAHIRNLTIDGDQQPGIGQAWFGRWERSSFKNITVRGGNTYQINCPFDYCYFERMRIIGNAAQTNNGWDGNISNSVINGADIDLAGNLLQTCFWLNGADNTVVINMHTTDGISGIGYEQVNHITYFSPTVGYSGAAPGANPSITGFPGAAGSRHITIINPRIDRVDGTGAAISIDDSSDDPHSDVTIIGGAALNCGTPLRLNNNPERVLVIGYDMTDADTPSDRISLTGATQRWNGTNKLLGCHGLADSTGATSVTTGGSPDVTGSDAIVMEYTATENVTGFTDARASSATPYVVRRLSALFTNSNVTLKQSATFQLQDGIDYRPDAGMVLEFRLFGNVWYEMPRGRGSLATALTTSGSNTDATSYTTASVSPRENRLLLLAVENARGAGTPTTPTVTGCGLTWVQVATVAFATIATPNRRLTVFRAMGAAPTAGTLTIDCAGVTQLGAAWTLIEVQQTDTSGSDGSGAVVQSVTASNDSDTSEGVTLASFAQATNYTFLFAALATETDMTPGSGLVGLAERSQSTPAQRLEAFWQPSANTTPATSWSGAGACAAIGIEVQSA